ncbi:MAG: transposase [Hydrogenophaga sp.]|nr:transposase [Hydrogenophaga sp.]MDP1893291.1 transposase [Hydrogenophaga sp.]
MSEIDTEVMRRLVIGRKNDGRAIYDPQAKAAVVRACLKPGVSVARMALQCGLNANLLRRWITQSMGSDKKTKRADMARVATASTNAFVPLRLTALRDVIVRPCC